jgi:hypothetical protein
MFLAKRPCEAVTKLCGYDFGVFKAPSAFALGDAGDGEHWFFLSGSFPRKRVAAGNWPIVHGKKAEQRTLKLVFSSEKKNLPGMRRCVFRTVMH